ncbi:hypothetical protein D1007_59860 [Hordeum vulgare]|nr:hypothetical protein D1007_59860 [Hordeum vulgare]
MGPRAEAQQEELPHVAGRATAGALSLPRHPFGSVHETHETTMLLLRASPAPAAASSFFAAPTLAYATTRSSFSPAARCSVGNLSPVQFEPLRADADADPAFFPAGPATSDGEDQYQPQPQPQKEHDGKEEDDQEGKKGGINVPRQRYIAVPKAALLDAALSLFPSQPAAAEDFRRFARPATSPSTSSR